MSTPVRTKPLPVNLLTRARSQPDNPRFDYALFQQALVQHNVEAWALVQERYQPLVCTWIKARLTHNADEARLQQLAQQAFAKLRAAFVRHPQKFYDFPHLEPLLGLLRLCAGRVTLTGLALVLALCVTYPRQPVLPPANVAPARWVTVGAADHLAFYHQQMKIEAEDGVVPGATPSLHTVVAPEDQGGNHCPAASGQPRALCIT